MLFIPAPRIDYEIYYAAERRDCQMFPIKPRFSFDLMDILLPPTNTGPCRFIPCSKPSILAFRKGCLEQPILHPKILSKSRPGLACCFVSYARAQRTTCTSAFIVVCTARQHILDLAVFSALFIQPTPLFPLFKSRRKPGLRCPKRDPSLILTGTRTADSQHRVTTKRSF